MVSPLFCAMANRGLTLIVAFCGATCLGSAMLLGPVLLLSGCPTVSSPKDWASHGIGGSIEGLLKAVDRDYVRNPKKEPSRDDVMKARYKLANGNTVYPIPIVFGRCKVHWEVNPEGIVVGYRYEDVIKDGCNW